MKTYIELLASELLRRFGTDMSRVAVVFPNKRASLFLNQELARQASTSLVWSPSHITISDLFRRQSPLQVADQILLVCRLFDVYRRITGMQSETLDHFYNWGLLLLADFDDLDKNMADAAKVFRVVSDIHELDNDAYLTDMQRKVLSQFFNTFNDGHSTYLRERFIKLWSRLYDIYTTFRDELRRDNIAYEGMLYRDVAENLDLPLKYDMYCFVGFNMLQQVEQRLFLHIKDAGKALFFWDYDDYYLTSAHEAGHFIREYLNMFPDAMADSARNLIHQNLISSKKQITYISAPTENLQARYVHDWLLENDRWKAGARTAIVMCDERLLQTIVRSLPDEVKHINVTTGYPLSQSPAVSLLQFLIDMQTAGRVTGTDKYHLRYVNKVLRHPYAQILSPLSALVCRSINNAKNYFPSRHQLFSIAEEMMVAQDAASSETSSNQDITIFRLLFTDVDTITGPDGAPYNYNTRITLWLQQIIRNIALRRDQLSQLDSEALFRTYLILQRLFSLCSDGTLDVDIVTYRRLLIQIITSTTVPYHGEPLQGIQIMGVLETRCLDFDHLLVLSCNEGNMPKGVNDASFIPHSVRKAYGMTTVQNKVGIYSYYFHRLLQRASDVSIAYNTSTEGLNSSEMSRFMLQLMVESGIPVRRISLRTGQDNVIMPIPSVTKDHATIELLRQRILYNPDATKHHAVSPSSLSTYLRCPLRYYYTYVMGLRQEEEDIDEMDNRTFGLIFHKAAENAYNAIADDKGYVYPEVIDRVLDDKGALARFVDAAFSTELFHINPSNASYRPEYSGLHLINRRVILRLLRELLIHDRNAAPFRIIFMEKYVSMLLDITLNSQSPATERVMIGGVIDRLDLTLRDDMPCAIRVIDYKTGSHRVKSGDIPDVDAVFNSEFLKNHSDYFLQAMMYSSIVRHHSTLNEQQLPVQPHLMFVQHLRTDNYTSLLAINKNPITDILDYEQEYLGRLAALISEITNPEVPFAPTSNTDHCRYCPFIEMCQSL